MRACAVLQKHGSEGSTGPLSKQTSRRDNFLKTFLFVCWVLKCECADAAMLQVPFISYISVHESKIIQSIKNSSEDDKKKQEQRKWNNKKQWRWWRYCRRTGDELKECVYLSLYPRKHERIGGQLVERNKKRKKNPAAPLQRDKRLELQGDLLTHIYN